MAWIPSYFIEPDGSARCDRWHWSAIARVIMIVMAAILLVILAALHSPVSDEIAYLPSGLHHLEQGRFELVRANPPLVRLIAAIPVMIVGYKSNWRCFDPTPGARSEFQVGGDFVEANGARSFFLFAIARWACIPLVLLGGFVCWKWAAELYGQSAGLLALSLWCFCPNILGNGALMTPDAACASLGGASGYVFWRWLREPSWTAAAIAGGMLGLAELTKGTWLILFALWPALYVFWRLSSPPTNASGSRVAAVAQLGVIATVALLVMNAAYLFQDTGVFLRNYEFTSAPLRGFATTESIAAGPTGNRFRGTSLGNIPVPLPKQFVLGVDTQWTAFDRGRPAYLLGTWKYGGWWYYYVVAMAVKIPLGAWVLAGTVVVLRIRDPRSRTRWRDEVVLLAPAIAALLFISLKGGINRHFRYVLPALPFIYIWLGSSAILLSRPALFPRLLVLGSACWFVVSSLLVFPHSQTYFNELCGGPAGGSRVLLGSSISWGQDLFFLKHWIQSHPEAQPLYVLTDSPFLRPQLAGIDHPLPPESPTPGWYAVSINSLYDPDCRHAYLQHFKPVDRVAYSINVYHLTEEELRQ